MVVVVVEEGGRVEEERGGTVSTRTSVGGHGGDGEGEHMTHHMDEQLQRWIGISLTGGVFQHHTECCPVYAHL